MGFFLFSLSLFHFLLLFSFSSSPSSPSLSFFPLFASSLPPGFFLTSISVQSPLHLSRHKEALFRGYGQIPLLISLSPIHNLSEEGRQVSSFGTRRNTAALGDNAQQSLTRSSFHEVPWTEELAERRRAHSADRAASRLKSTTRGAYFPTEASW